MTIGSVDSTQVREFTNLKSFSQINHRYSVILSRTGLLWIWSGSGRPVNPNANISTFANKTDSINKVPVKVLNQSGSRNETTLTTGFPEILGDGRCLRLSYNPSLFNYGYTGHDCSGKQHYMCVILNKSLDNEIKRIAKELKFEF